MKTKKKKTWKRAPKEGEKDERKKIGINWSFHKYVKIHFAIIQ